MEHGYRRNLGKTLHVQFYMNKANLMTDQDVVYVRVKAEPYTSAGKLKKFNYKVKIVRRVSTDLLVFRLVRCDESWTVVFSGPEFTVPASSSTDWVHFGLSIGYGVLYFTDAENAKFKVIEHLHAWQQGTAYSETSSITSTGPLTSIRDTGFNMFYSLEIELEAFKNAQESTKWSANPFGIRVWNWYTGYGAYPAALVATKPVLPDNKCYMTGFFTNSCLSYAFLQNDADFNPRSSVYDGIGNRRASCGIGDCRYCFMQGKCMFAVGAVNEDLHMTSVTFTENQVEGLEYDAGIEKPFTQHRRFVNNLGRDYYVRCPLECEFMFFFGHFCLFLAFFVRF